MPKKLLNNPAFLLACVTAIVAVAGTLSPRTKSLVEAAADSTSPRAMPMPLSENWTVVSVADGDTITVRQTDGKEMKVRLGCIDAPETPHGKAPGQLLGEESKKNLQRLVDEADAEVMVNVIDTDKYGRKVGEVFTSVKGAEKSLNEEQLSSGMAYFYKKYSNCPNREVFETAEQIAIASKAGVWGKTGLEKPWEYRRRQREK